MQTVQSDIIRSFSSKDINIFRHERSLNTLGTLQRRYCWVLAGFACIYLDGSHELAEPLVLLADLEGELPGVAHHQHGHLPVHRLDLLQRGQHEHRCLQPEHVTRLSFGNNCKKLPFPCRTWPGRECPCRAPPGGCTRAAPHWDARNRNPQWLEGSANIISKGPRNRA